MSLAQTILDMIDANCPQESIAAFLRKQRDRENEALLAKREKERLKKRRQRSGGDTKHVPPVPDVPGDIVGQQGTSGDNKDSRGDIYTTRAPALFPVGLSNDNPPIISPQKAPQSTENRKTAQEAAEAFERFWAVWPNKVGKPTAAKAFLKVWREADAIIAGVNRYMRDKPADRPWLNPATFLNQRRWEDAPAPVARAGPEPPSGRVNGFMTALKNSTEKVINERREREAAALSGDVLGLPFSPEARGRSGGDD